MKWFLDHLDKWLPLLFTTILAGIVGYFSGIATVRREVNDLQFKNQEAIHSINEKLDKLQVVYDTSVAAQLEMKERLDRSASKSDVADVVRELGVAKARYELDSSLAGAYKNLQSSFDLKLEMERDQTLIEVRRIMEEVRRGGAQKNAR